MANKLYEETHIQAIANAIREKTGTDTKYDVSEMATGVNEVYEAGEKSEYDAFWNSYQNNGGKMIWGGYAFAYGFWNDSNFFPKYDIITGGGASIAYFYGCKVTNLRERIDGRGLKLVIFEGNWLSQFFRDAVTTEVPEMDTSKSKYFTEMFRNCPNLVTIPKINVSLATNVNDMFFDDIALQNITFEGEIPLSLSFAQSPLTVASLKSVITHLKDYSGTDKEYTYTITFKATAFAELEAEGTTAEYNGTACTWTECIDNLKWNLVKS